MDEINNTNPDINMKKTSEKDLQYGIQPVKSKSVLPTVIGFLLIVAGVVAIVNWLSIFLININTLGDYYNVSQIQQVYPNVTPEQFLGFLKTCATIGIVVSVFPILGGILAIRRKNWGICLACSIIGLLSIGILFTSSLFSFIAIVILFVSKKDFQ